MTRIRRVFILLLIAGSFAVPRADCAVIYLLGSNDPIAGYLISESAQEIVLRQIGEDGGFRDVTYNRAELAEFLPAFSEDRLESLDPQNPRSYRDYAEELAVRRIDPEAIEMAIRLYLITADLGDDPLKRSALRGLFSIARTPAEERRFRTLAYLLDPDRNQAVLVEPDKISMDAESLSPAARRGLAEALKLLRTGRNTEARRAVDVPEVKRAFKAFEDIMSHEQFLQACFQQPLSDSNLARVLSIELALSDAERFSFAGPTSSTSVSWGQTMQTDSGAVRQVTLLNVTEFDPRLSVYRDGEWREQGE